MKKKTRSSGEPGHPLVCRRQVGAEIRMSPDNVPGTASSRSSSGKERTFVVRGRLRNRRFQSRMSASPTTRIRRSAPADARCLSAFRTSARNRSPRNGTGRTCCRMLIRSERFREVTWSGLPGGIPSRSPGSRPERAAPRRGPFGRPAPPRGGRARLNRIRSAARRGRRDSRSA